MRYLSLLATLLVSAAIAQPPAGYYDSAAGLTGEPLREALRDIIGPHTVIQYSQLWSAFTTTDRKPNNTVWDIYSDVPDGTPPYSFAFATDQCGTYDSEADCFNREHTFPVSWFNDVPPMNSDLFHIYPTDGWVNQQRGSWPYGEVSSAAYTSQNGSMRGDCDWPGCSGTVFEPIDAYKGDLARGYFYMLTRYMNESGSWPAPILLNGEFVGWTESLLLAWHTQDPVSQKEQDRNNAVYQLQGNRNPYIDNPTWVYSIWGPQASVEEPALAEAKLFVSGDELWVQLPSNSGSTTVELFALDGRKLNSDTFSGNTARIGLSCARGGYVAVVSNATERRAFRFVR